VRKKPVTRLIITLAIVFCLAAYAAYLCINYYFYNEYAECLAEYGYESGSAFTPLEDSEKSIPKMVLAAENDILKLYTNTKTTEVAVYDKRSGEITYSNPPDRDKDTIASGRNKIALNSQFMVSYYDKTMTEATMYNYDFSVEREQYEIEKLENGIRYIYFLGDLTSPTGIVPPIINKERLEQMVLSKLDEKDARSIRNNYMESKDHPGFLELTAGIIVSKVGLQKMNKLFEQAGYTTEDFDLTDVEIAEDIIRLVDRKLAHSYTLIPVKVENEFLHVAMSDPVNIFAIDDLRLATGYEIKPMLADSDLIIEKLEIYYKQEAIPEPEEEEIEEIDFENEIEKVKEEIEIEVKKEEQVEKTINISDVENAPIVRLVNMIFKSAIDKGASDIHIEAYEDCVMVRFRIDGRLVEVMKQDKKIQQILVARIKIISGLNIAEKRIPQDGRIALKINNKNYDFRVSTLPTMFGEKVVIRVLDKEGFNKAKNELGFFDDDLVKFDSILSHPHGIVLVTGPTGSGKSTTLYTALRELCKPNVNIMTVEDPVEATVRGVNQVQVNVKAGLTFASALRAFLRQDPDIIMVGEIRDRETAEIAIRAAITGHLVLSTLHTNDSVSSIDRLIDMGVEPFLIASSLVGVLAQRLVRRLCAKCKEEYIAREHEMKILKLNEETKLYKPVGCPECNGSGYKGRIAAYEILTINSETRDLISQNASVETLRQLALKNGMKTLSDSCTRLILTGVTSLEEMMSVISVNE
jgi:type IV pilus assembly protein PilB